MVLHHTWYCMFSGSLKEVPFFSLPFDKSYNDVLKKVHMDLHVRYWEDT